MAEAAQQFEDPSGFPTPDGEGEKKPEIEIEIVDDVPEEDRDRKPRSQAERVDPDSAELEEEIKDYGENAQQRIKQIKYEFHEERRAKEAAERQSAEAIRYAEQVAQDNASLKQTLDSSNNTLIEQYGEKSDAQLEAARQSFKEAYEGGDTGKLMEANESLARLHAERVRAGTQAEEIRADQARRQAAAERQAAQPARGSVEDIPPPDPKGTKWIQDNMWFQAPGYEEMTGYAVGFHEKLVKQGYDPRHHAEYYTKIEEALTTAFPSFEFPFNDPQSGDQGRDGGNPPPPPAAIPPRNRPPPVGGPTRGGAPPRKVQLTPTQVALAKRLGLTNQQYAAQVIKEMADG